MEDRRNLQIWDNNGRVVTDDDTLNNIIRSVEDEEDAVLGAVIPAVSFEGENPDEKVYLLLLSIYDTNSTRDDIIRHWEIKVGRQATYDALKELVKYEAIDPNTSFIIGGSSINADIIINCKTEARDNIKFNDVSPITVFRFLKAMKENHKVLDGDDMFNIDDFEKEDVIAFGDKTIFEI